MSILTSSITCEVGVSKTLMSTFAVGFGITRSGFGTAMSVPCLLVGQPFLQWLVLSQQHVPYFLQKVRPLCFRSNLTSSWMRGRSATSLTGFSRVTLSHGTSVRTYQKHSRHVD
jgi:hypothetical protein